MQGGSAISKDLPPFTVVSRTSNMLCGLNNVGLRRAGFMGEERRELKQLYRQIFLSGANIQATAAQARQHVTSEPARILLGFIASSTRGVCSAVPIGSRRYQVRELESEAQDS
jgi:UDP-N-acetylglucosamine acyltransferase